MIILQSLRVITMMAKYSTHQYFCTLIYYSAYLTVIMHDARNEECELFVEEAKYILIDVLKLTRDYPMKEYLRQISEDRVDIRNWLEHILQLIEE